MPAYRLLLVCCLAVLVSACGSLRPSKPTRYYAPLTVEQSQDIAVHALGLVDTPYRYGGNTPDSGFDCSGLINYVYRTRAGVAPPRTTGELGDFGMPIDRRELRTGDLVVFGGGRPFHAGIYVGDGRFVHAPSSGGTVRMDRLDGIYWGKQRVAYRRP